MIRDIAKSEHRSSLPGGARLASLVHRHLAQYHCTGLALVLCTWSYFLWRT